MCAQYSGDRKPARCCEPSHAKATLCAVERSKGFLHLLWCCRVWRRREDRPCRAAGTGKETPQVTAPSWESHIKGAPQALDSEATPQSSALQQPASCMAQRRLRVQRGKRSARQPPHSRWLRTMHWATTGTSDLTLCIVCR